MVFNEALMALLFVKKIRCFLCMSFNLRNVEWFYFEARVKVLLLDIV